MRGGSGEEGFSRQYKSYSFIYLPNDLGKASFHDHGSHTLGISTCDRDTEALTTHRMA
jgi:hypothetical protein